MTFATGGARSQQLFSGLVVSDSSQPRGLQHARPPSSRPLPRAEFLTLAPGSDRIPVELFQILKDDAVESAALNMQYAICTQYAICRLTAVGESGLETC